MLWKDQTQLHSFSDIGYYVAQGVAKIVICRPEVRNAFRPQTVEEMLRAFRQARQDRTIGVILLRGEGERAFCSGGDQRVRGKGGYCDEEGLPHLNVLELQREIRSSPKVVIAVVSGYAIGGGHVLHLVCDLTIAAENARFGQSGPRVGSFDGGFGAGHLARIIGQKRAREFWFLCRQYDAREAYQMGLVNCVVSNDQLDQEAEKWAGEILQHSPTAIRCLKAAFNAESDGLAGIQELAGNATRLYYLTEEGREGHRAFLEKRPPDFSSFPRDP